MKNPAEMNRTELKDLIRASGWDHETSLSSSTEDLREFVASKLSAETVVVTPEPPSASDLAGPTPAPLPAPDAPLPPEGDSADPEAPVAPEGAPAGAGESDLQDVASMTSFALRFGKASASEIALMDVGTLRELCVSLSMALTDEQVEQLEREGGVSHDPIPFEVVEPAPVKHYRVARFARWVSDGVVYQLRAGSFVSSSTHPVDELLAQGVPLEEVDAADDSDPGLGHRFA